MKKLNSPSKIFKLLFLIVLVALMAVCCYGYHLNYTYHTISVVMNENAAIEYGAANYNLGELIKKIDGELVSVKSDIDTNLVGEQEVVLEVKKENVIKDVPLKVSIIDTVEPVIEIKEEKVTITQGNQYNLIENINFVKDDIDGDIPYSLESDNFFYKFNYEGDIFNTVGTHEIQVLAVDKNGNASNKNFVLEVVVPKKVYRERVYTNLAPNQKASDIVSIATSYLGYPYVGGTNGPYSFDCSGFVQYVYSLVGISVSRSASTQIYDGVAVSYDNIAPGDIISWGYSNGTVTHSALYIGNGQMIHAANPSLGVVQSDVSSWLRGSGTQILSVRRIS